MFDISQEQDVYTLTMRNGENRFSLDTLAQLNAKLDEIARAAGDGPGAVVLAGEGKFWSNGIDLDWWSGAEPDDANRFLPTLNHFLGRVLTFPLPVVAALNGHTFAGGAMLALACDYRVMRSDRGWFCLPEIDINMPFHPSMMALLRCKMSRSVLRDAALSGRRYVAQEAHEAGIADVLCPLDELLPRATDLAKPLSTKNRKVFAQIKQELYGEAAARLSAEFLAL